MIEKEIITTAENLINEISNLEDMKAQLNGIHPNWEEHTDKGVLFLFDEMRKFKTKLQKILE